MRRALATLVSSGTHLALVVVAAHAVVTVPLAMVGQFHAHLIFPLVAVVAVALFLWDRRSPFGVPEGPVLPMVLMLVAVAAAGAHNVGWPTQHYATNRDPGVYVATALLLQQEHDLLFEAPPEELTLGAENRARGSGFYDVRDDGRLYAQFAHLTAATLSAADMVAGPTGLTRVNALVGSVGLVALWFLVRRLLDPWAATLAVSTLAWSLPQMYFSRGPYSEPLAQLLLIGGLAVLLGRGPRSVAHMVLAGLLLGGVIGSRIDAILLVPPLLVSISVWWVARPGQRRLAAAFGAGAALTAGIGLLDLRLFSPQYLSDLWSQFRAASLMTLAVALVCVVVVTRWRWFAPLGDLVARHRWRLGDLAAGATVVVGLALWLVRPLVLTGRGEAFPLVEFLQARQGLELGIDRSYAEDTLWWMAWYVGPATVLLAIVGAAVAVRELFHRWSWAWFTVLLTLGVPTGVYVIRPSITPDHLWAMRRFVPTALPLTVLLAATGVVAVWRLAAPRLDEPSRRVLVGGLVAVVLVPTLFVSEPYWRVREVQLPESALGELCVHIGGAPTLVDEADGWPGQLLQPISGRCGVPTAILPESAPWEALLASEELAARGEQLAVVTSAADLGDRVPALERVGTVVFSNRVIERSVERSPEGLEPDSGLPIELFVYRALRSPPSP